MDRRFGIDERTHMMFEEVIIGGHFSPGKRRRQSRLAWLRVLDGKTSKGAAILPERMVQELGFVPSHLCRVDFMIRRRIREMDLWPSH